jgi:hypothetical protein
MERIMACMTCAGRDLDAVYSHKMAFLGTYHCRECDHIGPVVTFDDWESYEEFKKSLTRDG